MDAAPSSRDEEEQRLLTRLAELMIEEQTRGGMGAAAWGQGASA